MSYSVAYSEKARQDIRAIYEYLAVALQAPETAASQIKRIMMCIRKLNEMPLRYKLYEDEPWHSEGIRFFAVDNFLVFYLPDTQDLSVDIVRIMYGGRDISKQM